MLSSILFAAVVLISASVARTTPVSKRSVVFDILCPPYQVVVGHPLNCFMNAFMAEGNANNDFDFTSNHTEFQLVRDNLLLDTFYINSTLSSYHNNITFTNYTDSGFYTILMLQDVQSVVNGTKTMNQTLFFSSTFNLTVLPVENIPNNGTSGNNGTDNIGGNNSTTDGNNGGDNQTSGAWRLNSVAGFSLYLILCVIMLSM